jgi:hypothetical protein
MRLAAVPRYLRSTWWGLILAEHDTEPTEFGGGLMKIGLGALLLTPADTFGSSRIYTLLSALPEVGWGLLLIFFGILHLAALHDGNRSLRRMAALAGFMIWATFSLSFFLGNPTNTGFVVYGLLACAQGWCYIRLGRLVVPA